jgi:hypothetical protein
MMKIPILLLSAICLVGFAGSAFGQGAGAAFQVSKITQKLISTPQYSYSGAEQYQANQRDFWLEVEVEFTATAEFSDDVTFKYFILVNGKVLTGEVTHTNVMAGRSLRSVMYASPKVLARFNGNRPTAANTIQNIAVQIVQQGTVKDEASMTRAPALWYASLPQLPGFLLNKNDTPFAPLYWDRYEQIKPAGH